ncbi:MAG: DUF305 domain-containing protein [Pseudonocardiaceae bacterium]|nr:DUF305 domain-containing protein [Pseudonocardiaceae bacterium]
MGFRVLARQQYLARALAAAAAALALTACGGGDGAQSGGEQDHNQADVTFLQGMIPHHDQAIEMSQLAEDRTDSEQLLELASEIEGAQGPEIETMTSLLEEFGADVPSTGMGGMDHSSMGGMQGMMSPQQMEGLEQLSGREFDQAFLQMMIEHHQGAITSSETVLQEGQNPAVDDLAGQIIEAQQAEIEEMSAMLPQG